MVSLEPLGWQLQGVLLCIPTHQGRLRSVIAKAMVEFLWPSYKFQECRFLAGSADSTLTPSVQMVPQ